MSNAEDTNSDKHYWHQYVDTYREAFQKLGKVSSILEYGVLRGDSIRWLCAEFPNAQIIGADILEPMSTWPRGDRIRYFQLDQGDSGQVRRMLEMASTSFDLVIEDGSHVPQHQARCLCETLPYVVSGGLYILEDIHTSHPDQAAYKTYCSGYDRPPATALHVLLAMQHIKATGAQLTESIAEQLASPGFFAVEEVHALFRSIAGIELYKRTRLPLRCYNCGSANYDYTVLRCSCGVSLYEAADSMSFLIRKA